MGVLWGVGAACLRGHALFAVFSEPFRTSSLFGRSLRFCGVRTCVFPINFARRAASSSELSHLLPLKGALDISACFQIPRLWLECTASAVVQGGSMGKFTLPLKAIGYTFLKVISDLYTERNVCPRGSGKPLLFSSNFGRIVLGCMNE